MTVTEAPGAGIAPDLAALLDAHVAYEMGRLTGPALDASVREDVRAVFAWLAATPVRALLDPATVTDVVHRQALQVPVTAAQRALVADVAADVHATLLDEGAAVDEVLPEPTWERLVDVVIGMDGVRQEVMRQLTESSVYSRLVAHLLYHGIKSYLLTENLIARKVPGAGSLVRLGQRGLNAAAPGLDNALVSFVNANIKDTVRESQRYLDRLLDEPLLRRVAGEVRAANAGRGVGEATGLVSEAQVRQAADVGVDVWLAVRGAPMVRRVVAAVVTAAVARHGDRPADAVLADLGVTEEAVAAEAVALLRPVVERAAADGHLEARVRERLAGFYVAYGR